MILVSTDMLEVIPPRLAVHLAGATGVHGVAVVPDHSVSEGPRQHPCPPALPGLQDGFDDPAGHPCLAFGAGHDLTTGVLVEVIFQNEGRVCVGGCKHDRIGRHVRAPQCGTDGAVQTVGGSRQVAGHEHGGGGILFIDKGPGRHRDGIEGIMADTDPLLPLDHRWPCRCDVPCGKTELQHHQPTFSTGTSSNCVNTLRTALASASICSLPFGGRWLLTFHRQASIQACDTGYWVRS